MSSILLLTTGQHLGHIVCNVRLTLSDSNMAKLSAGCSWDRLADPVTDTSVLPPAAALQGAISCLTTY